MKNHPTKKKIEYNSEIVLHQNSSKDRMKRTIKVSWLNRSTSSKIFHQLTIINEKFVAFLVVLAIYDVTIKSIKAQYGNYDMGQKANYNPNYGGAYGGHEEEGNEVDERPRVQLGVRLRIPAFRFELPRVNLPKITVSAKIRQPDRPRTINLPEINLDTSSKVSAPGLGTLAGQTQVTSDNGGYGGYNAASTHNKPAYQIPKYSGGDSRELINHFSFSTSEETLAKRYPDRSLSYRHKPTYTDYSSSQSYPSNALAEQINQQNFNNYYQSRDPDLGFNMPVSVDPAVLSEHSSNLYNSNQVMPYRMIGSNINKNGSNQIESGIQNPKRNHQIRTRV